MISEAGICYGSILFLVPVALCLARLIAILPALRLSTASKNSKIGPIRPNANITILLGSGGHTGEMLRLLENIDISKCTRTWLVSSGDEASLKRARAFEENIGKGTAYYATLHRARKVNESLWSSLVSITKSLVSTIVQFRKLPTPDVLLLNGPGTCVPVAYISFFMKLFGLGRTRIVYVESLARVTRLSLSGRFILPIADRFLVQWENLALTYRRAEYHGILI